MALFARVFDMSISNAARSTIVPWKAAKPRDSKSVVTIGDSFTKQVRFDAASIASFALLTGDTNPLHHNAAYAAQSRFGGIIASGAHVTALLTGMVAGHFSDKGLTVGLDFSFRFEAPVRLDDLVSMRWTITGRTEKMSLKGDIVTLEGEAVRSDGIVAVSSAAHVLMMGS
jgi:acyl dehydratase